MSKFKSIWLFLVALFATFQICPALASEFESRGWLNLNAGTVGILDSGQADSRYGIEYRFAASNRWKLAPAIGMAVAENDATYTYAGLRRDFRLGDRWLVTPILDIGAFHEVSKLGLGDQVEFREGIELGYRMGQTKRIGLALYHLSNGGIGDRNPGTEAATLSFSMRHP